MGIVARAPYWRVLPQEKPCRRWVWARREMERPNGFFSEDALKARDPQLFHKIIGQHLDSSVPLSSPMQGGLSSYLMQQLEKECCAADGATIQSNPGESGQ